MLAIVLLLLSSVEGATKEEWASRTIYQVITDRFALSEGEQPTCSAGTCRYGNYCGGTFKGIENHLGYIKDLGFDAIWISPVPENTKCGYHGYYAYDLYNPNPHFGTKDELKSLVETAHSMGIWVMVDIVANHMGPTPTVELAGFFPQLNSTEDFHPHCIIDFPPTTQENIEMCWLGGFLPDVDSESPYVQKVFYDWIADLVETYGFDGIRIDTVPYVPKWFWKEFNDAVPDSFTIGEVLILPETPEYVAGYIPSIDSILHYPMFWPLRNVFTNGSSFEEIHDAYISINEAFRAEDIPYLGTFVDNHDQDRFLYVNDNHVLLRNALTFIYGIQGIPIVYYGTEQGMNTGGTNDVKDTNNRAPLWDHGGYNENSELANFIRQLNSIHSMGVFTGDQMEVKFEEDYYVFSREAALVVVSNQDQVDVSVENLPDWVTEGMVLQDLLSADDANGPQMYTVSSGTLSFSLNGEPLVLVKSNHINEKPKLYTLDQEYHLKESDTDAVMEKEENWLRKERREKEAVFSKQEAAPADTPLVVKAFAALGFVTTLYGAFKHYTKQY